MEFIAAQTIIEEARQIKSNDNNPEYDRALVELVYYLIGQEGDLEEIQQLILGE